MSKTERSLLTQLRELAPYYRGTAPAFTAGGIAAVIGAATELAFAWMTKPLIDRGFLPDGFPLWAVPVFLIGLFAVRGIAGFVLNYVLAWASHHATVRMRESIFARLMRVSPQVMVDKSASSLINTVVYELQTGATLLVSAVQTLLKDSFTVLALMGFLVWTNWRLTLFIALMFPAVAWTMRVFGRRMHRLTVQGQHATDELAYVVEENLLAWRIVRLHGAAARQAGRFKQASDLLRRLMLKSTIAASAVTPVTQLLAVCAVSAVIVVALWQAREHGSTVGTFVAYLTAMLGLITPLKHLSEVAGPVSRGLAGVQRGLEFAHHAPLEQGGTHAPGRTAGALTLREVSLQYASDAAPALDHVDLEIRAGETVALVGPSGAGKSTLVNLLPRFLDPSSGEVLLDGVGLHAWDLAQLRAQFALVSQDVVLFNDTVAANVAFGQEIDRDRVIAALIAANLLEHVQTLPQGVDSVIGHNGSQLSGGQRQRLAIARAIYKDAPVLLLDEATSALDSESERLVQAALERLMRGRTSIVIAHRLSTIERADRIVAMQAGRVMEQGSHEALVAAGGLYARLHALQFRS